jgi:putative transposase
MSNHPDADLVIDALLMGFERRRPDQKLIHHSDRGAAYTSLALGNRAAELGIARSFGSTGDCFDNAAVESLWATLNQFLNWIYGRKIWTSRILLRSPTGDVSALREMTADYHPRWPRPSHPP